MTLSRYEVLERLSDLLAEERPHILASATRSRLPDNIGDLPASVRHVELQPKASAPSLLLTVAEACAELRISRAQLYILTNKQRAIEMVHIGKLARIPRVSLETYVQTLRSEATQPGLASEHELCA
jgi:excisionase family DNA binding protein